MKNKKIYSVFLVDDNKVFITTLAKTLEHHFGLFLEISEFSTGEECLKNIKPDNHPDIVILDYFLNNDSNPETENGIKVLQKIKSISKDTQVIILSGQDKVEVAAESIKHGAYEYIAKSETAFVRVENALKNLFKYLKSDKENKVNGKLNVFLGTMFLILIILDIIWSVFK